MKNTIFILMIVGLLIIPTVLAANENSNDNGKFLSRILGTLKEILGKLTIIAEKETTVIVEPEIIVNIPEEECKFEKLNQKQNIGFSEGFGENDITDFFEVPLNKEYDEVIAISGRVSIECSSGEHGCSFSINEVRCEKIKRNTFQTYELSEDCINAITAGANNIILSVPTHGSGSIGNIQLEMEVKPANC